MRSTFIPVFMLFNIVANAQDQQTPQPSINLGVFAEKKQESVSGVVLDLWNAPNSENKNENVSFLILESKNSRLLLQLGPTWLQPDYENIFKKGQAISAVGFRLEMSGKSLFVPQKLSIDSKTILFSLPDQLIFPSWQFHKFEERYHDKKK